MTLTRKGLPGAAATGTALTPFRRAKARRPVIRIGIMNDQMDDDAYDGDAIYDEVFQRHPAARVIIPPRSTADLRKVGTTQQGRHRRLIEQHGQPEWQRLSEYGRSRVVETAMYRDNDIIGGAFMPGPSLLKGPRRKSIVTSQTGSSAEDCQSQVGSNNPNGRRKKAGMFKDRHASAPHTATYTGSAMVIASCFKGNVR